MALLAVGQTASFTVSETSYGGAFTATSGDTSIAGVSPGSATPAGAGANATFTITAAGAGKTTVVVRDAFGQTASVVIDVTTGSITVQGATRR